MTFAIHGLAVARGIAIGRAVLLAASHLEVAHYFITAAQVAGEIARVGQARDAVGVHLQPHEAAHGLDHGDHEGRGGTQPRAGRAVGVGH